MYGQYQWVCSPSRELELLETASCVKMVLDFGDSKQLLGQDVSTIVEIESKRECQSVQTVIGLLIRVRKLCMWKR
jgi:hypothetical protein